jgi:hypothetical protein
MNCAEALGEPQDSAQHIAVELCRRGLPRVEAVDEGHVYPRRRGALQPVRPPSPRPLRSRATRDTWS